MEIDANVLFAVIGQKEVELAFYKERVAFLESELAKQDDKDVTEEEQ